MPTERREFHDAHQQLLDPRGSFDSMCLALRAQPIPLRACPELAEGMTKEGLLLTFQYPLRRT